MRHNHVTGGKRSPQGFTALRNTMTYTLLELWRAIKDVSKAAGLFRSHGLRPQDLLPVKVTITTVRRLPLELWQTILDVSRPADRIRLRAVDRTLCELATPMVFRRLRFRNNWATFKKVIELPQIAKAVKEIDIVELEPFTSSSYQHISYQIS